MSKTDEILKNIQQKQYFDRIFSQSFRGENVKPKKSKSNFSLDTIFRLIQKRKKQ